jgi:hypothetical protein
MGLIMTSTISHRLRSAAFIVTAVGSLVIGAAGAAAAADPASPPPTSRFTVINDSSGSITFSGYDTKGSAPWIYEPAVAGPGKGHILKSGESWSVYMDANSKWSYALCVGSCDPIDRTKTASITLK